MSNEKTDYHAIMVRMWRDKEGETWRATAQDPHTGEISQFATLYDLFLYLNAKVTHFDDPPIWQQH